MLTGIASFLLFAVLLLVAGVRSGSPSPAPLWVTTTHVLTLGALLSFAMGASYQLVTVAFLTPLASVRGAAWNYWLYIGGLMGLWYSMALWWPTGLALFGTVTVLAVIVYAVIILASIHRSTVRGPMRGFVQAARAGTFGSERLGPLLAADGECGIVLSARLDSLDTARLRL
jgi:hypothetical protein